MGDGTIALWFLLLAMGYFDQLQSDSGRLEYNILIVFWSSSEMLLEVVESLDIRLQFLSVSIISGSYYWEGSSGTLCWLCHTTILTFREADTND